MYFNAVVTPPPAPVSSTQITFGVRYLIVRGDGYTKLCDSLYDAKALWQQPGSICLTGSPGGSCSTPEIIIPLDLLSALRLGLIQESELALPEGAKALLNMIK